MERDGGVMHGVLWLKPKALLSQLLRPMTRGPLTLDPLCTCNNPHCLQGEACSEHGDGTASGHQDSGQGKDSKAEHGCPGRAIHTRPKTLLTHTALTLTLILAWLCFFPSCRLRRRFPS